MRNARAVRLLRTQNRLSPLIPSAADTRATPRTTPLSPRVTAVAADTKHTPSSPRMILDSARLTSVMRLGHAPRANVLLSETLRPNVLLSSAYLMPVDGKAITAHSTRNRVLGLLEETRARRGDGERAMIVDVSATTWNWDTYAIVAGKPSPVAVAFSGEDELRERLPLEGDSKTVRAGTLVLQPSGDKVWMPKGARLTAANQQDDGTTEFIFEAPELV